VPCQSNAGNVPRLQWKQAVVCQPLCVLNGPDSLSIVRRDPAACARFPADIDGRQKTLFQYRVRRASGVAQHSIVGRSG